MKKSPSSQTSLMIGYVRFYPEHIVGNKGLPERKGKLSHERLLSYSREKTHLMRKARYGAFHKVNRTRLPPG